MKQCIVIAALAALMLIGFGRQASAQTIPSIQGIKEYSAQARYMSLTGYLRWQSFLENNIWITRVEAGELIRSQQTAAK